MPKKTVRIVAVLAFLVVASGAAWQFDLHHKIPIARAINPIWWYRYVRGTDLYDPENAVLYQGNPKYREVAITIDDGPHPQYGDKILAVLNRYHVPATFFVVGIKVKQDPQFIRTAIAEGDEIGNHTYNHLRLPTLPDHDIVNEMRFDDMDIYKAGGVHPTIMRPPGDEYDDRVSHILKSMGYVDVCWTDAAKDFLPQTPKFIADRVLDRVEPGSIILLHQDWPGTAEALPEIITGLEARHYKMVTIATMLAHLNVQPYAAQYAAAQAASVKKPATAVAATPVAKS